jgi:plastocyanin
VPVEVVDVLALDNTFRPETIEVQCRYRGPCSTNSGRNDHDVIPARATDDWWGVVADDFAPRDEYQSSSPTPGTYPYYCSIHGTTRPWA